jgi:hypothetical protein
MPARELEVGLDRLHRVVRVADDQTADDVHAVRADVADGVTRRIAGASAILTLRVLSSGTEEIPGPASRMFSMPRNT